MIYTPFESFQSFLKKEAPDLPLSPKETAQIIVTGSYQTDDYFDSHNVVLVPFTGTNNIDIALIKDKGMHLFNSNVHSQYVAERALTLTLTLLGTIMPFHDGLKKGNWAGRTTSKRTAWTSLFNQSVGFLGYGAINQQLRTLMNPFNINAYTLDRGKRYSDVHGVKDIKELIEVSKVIVMALPLTKQTYHLMNADLINTMTGKYLINVGRGDTIEEKSLFGALKAGKLAGFASDVWWQYPKDNTPVSPSNHPFEELDNVVMTPHNGGFAEGAERARFKDTLHHIKAYLSGNVEDALDVDKILKYER